MSAAIETVKGPHNVRTPVAPCPSWCESYAGHEWDSIDMKTGVQWRGHRGPRFGSIDTGAEESDQRPGVLTFFAYVEGSSYEGSDSAALRGLAEDALKAAVWLEAHR